MDFEEMLAEHRQAVERFVKFRLPSPADAEEILQDVFVTAYHKREQLKNPAAFKPWLLSIARSKCHDYFRDRAGKMEIPLDDLMENTLSYGRFGLTHQDTVQDALMHLGNQDQQILYLFFWRQWPPEGNCGAAANSPGHGEKPAAYGQNAFQNPVHGNDGNG